MSVTYPVASGNTFNDQTSTLTKEAGLQVGSSAEVRNYWLAWVLAVGVGSLGSLSGGFSLCLLGLTLRWRAQPTETELIAEAAKPAAPPAPTKSSKPPLAGAIATEPTSPLSSWSPRATPSIKRRSGPLRYFHVKIYDPWKGGVSIHRVYLTEAEFLFVHLGISSLQPEDDTNNSVIVPGGGLLGGVIVGAVNKCVAAVKREQLNRLMKSLEAAKEEDLRQFISGDEHSFILSYSEVHDVRLEPRTFWGSFVCRDLLAFLKWSCTSRGELTLALIAPHEMTTVVEELQGIFSDMRNNLSWRSF
jgi:hypothetical protein